MKISAVLLAGGESRRFGRDKATFTFDGKPLWKRQLDTLAAIQPHELFVSARRDPSWRPNEVGFAQDAPPSRGPISGLVAAFAAMSGSHLLVLAIDMPFMTSDYLRFLIGLVTASCGIVPILNGESEPLAAVYPSEASETVTGVIKEGSDLSLRRLTSNLLRVGMMQPITVQPNESLLFRNINQLIDVTNRS